MANLKSPQQQIYDVVFLVAYNLGYSVFDYLPAKDAAYPFVFVGEQFDQDRLTKTSVYGRVQQTIHIYHTHRKRRELTTMMDAIKAECRRLKRTENFYLSVKDIRAQTLPDTTASEPLVHGIIEIDFQFN